MNNIAINKRYTILTNDGFKKFYGIRSVTKPKYLRIILNEGIV
jgi:hypothetical protein